MDKIDLIPSSFALTLTGDPMPISPIASKIRAHIFYRGENRNGGYITDEFAEKLMGTIKYAPVKGIFDFDNVDYTDHGEKRTEGRIYGVVPESPNFAWEKHVDKDGVEREYASVDVLIYTALYEEAKLIPDKALSMELYRPSIKGDWAFINGKKLYKYSDACFLGLQVLGNGIEPCFEGAEFFSLFNSLKDLVEKLEGYTKNSAKGEDKMEKENFALSHEDIRRNLFSLLNPNFNEEGGYVLDYYIECVYDNYALICTANEEKHERAYYTVNSEAKDVEVTSREEVYILDVTADELKALNALRALNGDSFAKIDETMVTVEQLNKKIGEYDTKIEELNNSISTLTTERDNANTQNTQLTQDLDAARESYTSLEKEKNELIAEKDALSAYKKNIEDNAKLTLIDTYADNLSEEVLDSYKGAIDNYSIEDLDIKLTYEVKKAHPEYFSKTPEVNPVIPTGSNGSPDRWGSILGRYEKH